MGPVENHDHVVTYVHLVAYVHVAAWHQFAWMLIAFCLCNMLSTASVHQKVHLLCTRHSVAIATCKGQSLTSGVDLLDAGLLEPVFIKLALALLGPTLWLEVRFLLAIVGYVVLVWSRDNILFTAGSEIL